MKKYIHMLETETSVLDTINRLVDNVQDPKQKDFQPGQYVIFGATNNVLKVVTVTGDTKTEQSYARELDINRLLEPAQRKGLLRHVTKFEGEYDDIPVADFREAQFIVAKGKSMFEALPSTIRAKFGGNPATFMEFVQNPENESWLRQHGIVDGIDGLTAAGAPTGYKPEEPPPAEEPPAEPPTT